MQVELRRDTSLPPELTAYRNRGTDRYNRSGLPGPKTEHWMKFDISPIRETVYTEADRIQNPPRSELSIELGSFCETVDLVNGYVTSVAGNMESGQSLYKIGFRPDQVGSAGDEHGAYFYDLNSSFLSEPLFIHVSKGKTAAPLHIAQSVRSEGLSLIANPRIIITVEEGAELKLIQSFSGSIGAASLHNSVTEIILGKNSRVDHLVLQEDNDTSLVFNSLYVRQYEGSEYNSASLSAGGSLSRNEYDISLKGENCKTSSYSLILGREGMIHNSDITVRHDAPGCISRNSARAIGSGDSQGVFRGFAFIAKGAQKSDAVQQLRTVLLDDRAQMNMEPHLEIWADDVKCSHGATVGRLDSEQLFYLQTRGYSESEAKKVLLRAFASGMDDNIDMGEAGRVVTERIYKLMDRLYE